jgi:hypothetical protein
MTSARIETSAGYGQVRITVGGEINLANVVVTTGTANRGATSRVV